MLVLFLGQITIHMLLTGGELEVDHQEQVDQVVLVVHPVVQEHPDHPVQVVHLDLQEQVAHRVHQDQVGLQDQVVQVAHQEQVVLDLIQFKIQARIEYYLLRGHQQTKHMLGVH